MNTGFGVGKIKSTFLWNDALPSTGQPPTIATLIGAHPTWNYVTGAVNLLNNLVLSMRSSWISGGTGSTQYYFRDIMNALNALFTGIGGVYFYIDNDGNLRLEHSYWFTDLKVAGLNITAIPQYKPESDLHKYSVDKSLLFSREHWVVNYNINQDFFGSDIWYNPYSTQPSAKEYRISVISTDITYLAAQPAGTAMDGMVLLNCDLLSTNHYSERSETGKISASSQRNGHMALANLIDKYSAYNRITKSASASWGALTINSAIPQILQNVKFPYTSDLSYFQTITTSAGAGMVSEDIHDLASDFHDVKLYLNAY
jgi:hypothetical protein